MYTLIVLYILCSICKTNIYFHTDADPSYKDNNSTENKNNENNHENDNNGGADNTKDNNSDNEQEEDRESSCQTISVSISLLTWASFMANMLAEISISYL